MSRIIFLILLVSLTYGASAQKKKQQRQAEKRALINDMIKQEEEGVIVYTTSFAAGGKLASDGYGVFFELGKAKSIKNSLLFQLDISERKHIKEDKQSNPFINSIPFIYGKQNFFYPVKLGVQNQLLLGNKSNKNGVSVTANFGGGLSLGLLRPYYLQVQKGNDLGYIKYDSPDSSLFLSGPIYGGPTFGRGWSEMTITPGVYAKTAFRFDYGAYNEIISAIEVGLTGEYYTKKIPILLQIEQKQFFFSAYAAIIFGKRS
ncbi:hypothetical protein BH20BAC1_BH20BAC1_21660 [soil metagenome]